MFCFISPSIETKTALIQIKGSLAHFLTSDSDDFGITPEEWLSQSSSGCERLSCPEDIFPDEGPTKTDMPRATDITKLVNNTPGSLGSGEKMEKHPKPKTINLPAIDESDRIPIFLSEKYFKISDSDAAAASNGKTAPKHKSIAYVNPRELYVMKRGADKNSVEK